MTYSILGKDETGKTIQIDQGARRNGMYIIGATGTGKSTLIQSLVLQDIEQGLGVCLLDPHGDLTNRVLETMTSRTDDVILLDVANDGFPFGLNLFACPYPTDIRWVQYTVNQVMHIFDRLYNITRETPNMSYFLRNCTYTIIANPGYTMAKFGMASTFLVISIGL
ncbi:MAG: helicase HerA domain-containing protein [Ktedonobacteraceae bacterium]